MRYILGKLSKGELRFHRDQRGITGLETAILLIAFVVVSSIFATTALSTGLRSSDKSKEVIETGIAEVRGTLELKGPVIARVSGTTGTTGVVTTIEFQVSNVAAGKPINLTPGNTVIKYSDQYQTVNMIDTADFTASNVASFGDSDSLLEPGEVFEIVLLDMTTQLSPDLGINREFTVEVIPPSGAILLIGRRTPLSLAKGNNLN